jgi:molybdopterin-guanine dinucleotide biosynthesis protein A
MPGNAALRADGAAPGVSLGAVLAGGGSTRYGAPKALATVGGRRIVDRVIDAVSATTSRIVLIANDSTLAAATPLEWRADAIAGLGALGGIHAALLWAREERRRGALGVACDMPFLDAGLLGLLVQHGETGAADVVVPESGGRRGIEPLCAFYSVACIEPIERAAAAGDQRMIGFHDQVRVERVPLEVVRRFGEPAELFLNVNTREDRQQAEAIAHERSLGAERSR